MSKKTWCSMLLALTLTLCFSGLAIAQEITGSIVGTVRDASGAAVAGATVTVTIPSQGNKQIRTVTTTGDGTFSIPNVPVNVYDVTVEAPNFKRSVSTNLKVDVGARRTVDVALEAGRIDETVTVTADPVAVELTTPTAATTITGDQVRELSINNRNFVQLVTLAPGVSSNLSDQVYVGNFNPEGQANTVSISVNGARSSQNTFTVDGADITDRGSNLTIQAYPSVDSIGEFRVLRSLYPAESGRSGGGQVNVVTRSGTDDFHGSLFEFVRNEKFNANTYFNNQTRPFGVDDNGKAKRSPFRYNNYGFTVGGPVYFLRFGERDPNDSWFGKMKRTYFFFSEEQRKDRRYPTLNGLVPTAGMRNGVFSFPICLSGTIAGSARTCSQVLPAGQALSTMAAINPVALQYLNGIFRNEPLPNLPPGVFSLFSPSKYRADFRQEIVKIDTSFTKNWTAYYRYQRDEIPTTEINSIFGNPCNVPDVCTGETNSPGRAHTFSTTYVINPNLIVEGRYTYTYGAILLDNTGLISRSRTPIDTPLPFGANDARIPNLAISGLSTIQAMPNYNNFSNKNDLSGSVTWIFGNHTTKYGASYSKYRKFENALGGISNGSFSGFNNTTLTSPNQGLVCSRFNAETNSYDAIACSGNQSTEQSFANFLLGNNVSFTQNKYDLTADFRQQNFEAFAQDEFRATKRLTLYYGVRYSFFGAPWDKNGFLTNFVPELWDPTKAPTVRGAGTRVSGTGNFCNGLIVNAQNYTTGPASFQCTPIASPYGKFIYKSPKNNFAPRVGLAWDPFGKGTTAIRTGYGIYHEQVLVGSLEQHLGVNPPYQETVTTSGVRLDQPVIGNATVVASENAPNLIRGWQTNFETPYMQHWSLDLQHQLDRNTVFTVGYYGSKGTNLIGVVDINNLKPGYALTQRCAPLSNTTGLPVLSVDCQQRDGAGTPIAFTSSAQELILDQIRPYRGWRNISYIQPAFDSNYHSLQVSATRRLGGASQVQLAYTWSKNLTNNQSDRSNAAQNSYDFDSEWSRAALDRRHILTVNYVYELPWFQKRHDFVGYTLGGWEVSGIVTYQTGIPFTITQGSFDPAGLGFLGSSPAGGRAYTSGDPNSGGAQNQQQWFNTGAFLFYNATTRTFVAPTSYPADPGSAARGIVNGPRTFRTDLTLSKNFRFTESMRLQLRGEAFNLFNTTNFTGFGTAVSTPSTFGVVNGTRDPRILQFGIKFYF